MKQTRGRNSRPHCVKPRSSHRPSATPDRDGLRLRVRIEGGPQIVGTRSLRHPADRAAQESRSRTVKLLQTGAVQMSRRPPYRFARRLLQLVQGWASLAQPVRSPELVPSDGWEALGLLKSFRKRCDQTAPALSSSRIGEAVRVLRPLNKSCVTLAVCRSNSLARPF